MRYKLRTRSGRNIDVAGLAHTHRFRNTSKGLTAILPYKGYSSAKSLYRQDDIIWINTTEGLIPL